MLFRFRKKESKSLFIKAKDVIEIIKEDYDNDISFCLIDFLYKDEKYTMGSYIIPVDVAKKTGNIYFVFQDDVYNTFEEFIQYASIENIKIAEIDDVIEIVSAGIVGKEACLKSPWGDTRLAKKAINNSSI